MQFAARRAGRARWQGRCNPTKTMCTRLVPWGMAILKLVVWKTPWNTMRNIPLIVKYFVTWNKWFSKNILSHTLFAYLAPNPFMLLEKVLSWNPRSDEMKWKHQKEKKQSLSFFLLFFRSLFLLLFPSSYLSFLFF